VVCPFREQPQFVNLETSERVPLPRDLKLSTPPATTTSHADESSSKKEEAAAPPTAAPAKPQGKISTATAVFTRHGEQIYVGDADGYITIINTATLQVDKSVAICPGSPIKSIVWSRDELEYLVNSTDKVIRLVDRQDHAVKFELFDAVNKIQWKKCCFSGDGDHIVAGSAQKHEHKIYIWSRHFKNNLIRMLEGPKEGILDLIWHPLRPIAVSCSTSGAVYVWNARYQESWSAFAPGFTELEENEEYIEREDEFDARDLEEEARRKKEQAEQQEDAEVDISTIPKNEVLSDDEIEEMFFLPVVPIPDWQMAGAYLVPESQKPGTALAAAAGLSTHTELMDDPIKATEQRRKAKAKRKAPTPGPADDN
jgi:COMPASS component SWD1